MERIKINNLKEMLNKTGKMYGERIAYKIRIEEQKYKNITHKEVREKINYLGTALIDLGLKGKKIAIIGENRFEWEVAYLSVVCGVGIVVPLDRSLPENELESIAERSGIEAIFYTDKNKETVEKIRFMDNNKLKHLISMELEENENGILSMNKLIKKGKKLVENGNTEYINAEINNEEMSIMLFTSGTTSRSKIVALSHKNICSNLMDIDKSLKIDCNDIFLSILPIHHVFECTVGFLLALYKGAQTVFCDGIRHIVENLNEYNVSIMACVPGIYERIFKIIRKQLEKQGKLEEILENEEKYRSSTMKERKKAFKEIHDMLGGNIKFFLCGAAALDPKIHERFKLLGINLVQGYGLTETSPVVAVETEEFNKIGTIGKSLPSIEVKLENINKEGMGELLVKGPTVMLGYYGDKKATEEAIKNGWFYTGDLAKIDNEGYIYICGRKKNVIVLKNGKNIFPEEIENLLNKIEGVEESFVYGKQLTDDKENIKINAQIVINKEKIKEIYKAEDEEEIFKVIQAQIKQINEAMPKYKAIRGIRLTELPLIKTTTNKIKRQENLDAINKLKN